MGITRQNTPAPTTAREAIFSKSGQVKQRIANYETTIVDTSEKILVFPPTQNSNEIDITGVLETVADITSESGNTFVSPIRFSTALVSFIIAITFSWSVYSIFFTANQDKLALEVSDSPEISNHSESETTKIVELKQYSDRLLADSAWNAEDINHFLNHWNKLSEQDVRQVTKTSWYQLLEFNVKKQIDQQHDLIEKSQIATISDQLLLTLGLVMGVIEQPGTGTKLPGTNDNSKYEQLLAELTNELKQADKGSKSGEKPQESESTLYAKLREKYAAPKQDLQKTPQFNKIATIAADQKQLPEKTDLTKTETITRNDINSVISSYKQAYENGDIKLMAGLFGAFDVNSPQHQKVTSSFTTTFNNTTNRTMNFYEVNTSSSGNTAIIDSKFNASVDFKNGKGTQYTVANMKLYVSKSGNRVTINRVNILDRKVNVVEKENGLLEPSNGMLVALDNKVILPTAAELQDITTQLVSSYETGNLAQFISLFSSEIKTNDRIDLTGVKQDYARLFASTSDRQMFIQNLKWSDENIGAKGTGDLEVIIFSEEGNTVYSMEGKIQIVAQKIDNKVRITHLYHIERAK